MNWGISIRRSHKLHHTLNGENPMSMPIWLLSLLPCTTYTGALVRGTNAKDKAGPVRVDNAFPCIISKAQFGRVKRLMHSRAPKRARRRRSGNSLISWRMGPRTRR